MQPCAHIPDVFALRQREEVPQKCLLERILRERIVARQSM
jgi:hypothetical protein